MRAAWDAIVIGGGVNGLTAAALLARAGRRILLLERREAVGGLTRSTEFAPGFRSAPLGLEADWVPPAALRALGIAEPERRWPDAGITVADGEAGPGWLALWRDHARAREAIRRYSEVDASRWGDFCERIAAQAGFLAALYTLPPPDVDATAPRELLPLLGVARKLRGLGRREMVELLRTVPMPVAELLDEWFAGSALKAALAAGAVRQLRQGPRSGGTSFGLLHQQVGAAAGAFRGRGYWAAGPGALADALAACARRHGAELRTGAAVQRILIADDRVRGVVLDSGEELTAALVLSSADPAHTLLGLVDPVWLDPEFLLAVRNVRFRGATAVISYALEALPLFPGLPDPEIALAGTLSLTPSLPALERAADAAKYGRVSERPHLELRFPSLRWSTHAPEGKHLVVAEVQWAPYRLRDAAWDRATCDNLAERVTAVIEQAAPGFSTRILAREVLSPAELAQRYGLSEGAPSHGEMSLDQILFMRPVPGAARYATPIAGLFLCGAGAHPGSGVSGGPGWLAARRALDGRLDR